MCSHSSFLRLSITIFQPPLSANFGKLVISDMKCVCVHVRACVCMCDSVSEIGFSFPPLLSYRPLQTRQSQAEADKLWGAPVQYGKHNSKHQARLLTEHVGIYLSNNNSLSMPHSHFSKLTIG